MNIDDLIKVTSVKLYVLTTIKYSKHEYCEYLAEALKLNIQQEAHYDSIDNSKEALLTILEIYNLYEKVSKLFPVKSK